MLKSPKSACCLYWCDEKLDLLVVVKTCAYYFEKRKFARSTFVKQILWSNFHVKFLFTIGIILTDNTNVFMFEDVNITRDKVLKEYLNNTWKLMNDTAHES